MAQNLAQLRAAPGSDGALIAQAGAQLSALSALKRQLDGANPMALRAAVAATVAVSSSLAQQARTAADASPLGQNAAQDLATASAEARKTVTEFERDMYERKIFDPYLRFSSAEDEEAYRKREAERLSATKKAEAEHTPQGDLRALQISIAQMHDAGAHGADQSPEYAPRLQLLESKEAALTAAIGRPSAQKTTADPLDNVTPVNVDPAILAALKSTGVVIADQSGQGHGVSAAASQAMSTQIG